MRIHGKSKQTKNSKSLLIILGGGLLLLLIGLLVTQFRYGQEEVFFCDAEKAKDDTFKGTGSSFFNGLTQSDDLAFSGTYSSKCSKEKPYGMGLNLDNIFSGDQITASAWRNSTYGSGSIAFQGNWGFYAETKEVKKTQGDWEYLEKTITIPIGIENESLKIFPYNPTKEGAVYFDNLEVKRKKAARKAPEFQTTEELRNLKIQIDETELKKLKKKRSEALAIGNLNASSDDLVPAKLHDGNTAIPVQVRLKGDLLDHLQGSKWSFRIRPEEGQAWNGFKEFSVHNSKSRHHLREWVYHKWLEKENILTSRYDFVQLALNEKVLGIYAYEEHFLFDLVEAKKRPKGPIIRFSEEGLWQNAYKNIKGARLPWFEAAEISPFQLKEIMNDEQLKSQYLIAQELLYSFKENKRPASDIFDIEKMAKFYAITDVNKAWHALRWTNLRFYFNPITSKLEPIGYDGFPGTSLHRYHGKPFVAYGYNEQLPKDTHDGDVLIQYLFKDMLFMEKYNQYLEQYSNKQFIENLLGELESSIKQREQLIQLEYSDYNYNWNYLGENARQIQQLIYPLSEIGVKAFVQDRSNGKSTIRIESYHPLPIQIIGFGNQSPSLRMEDKIILPSYHAQYPVQAKTITVASNGKNIFCRPLGMDTLISIPIFKWPVKKDELNQPSKADANASDFSFIQQEGNGKLWRISAGEHRINKVLFVPAETELSIAAGAKIVFSNGGGIYAEGKITAKGTASKPISFQGESKNSSGALVIASTQKSVFQSTEFKFLNGINQKGRLVGAALTAFNSDLSFKNCRFESITAAETLHFVDSKFNLSGCTFLSISGDAIDADYSKGTVSNSVFKDIGQDAIESSGSVIKLEELSFENILASALNANRKGRISGNSITINNSKNGISSKDLSLVELEFAKLNQIEKGFLAFSEEAGYGPARIVLKNYEATDVNQLYRIESGSSLKLKGKLIEGE